ncbi:Polyphosphate kinase [Alteripontixanthobacter maritimus]|uniref:Polyphosphate kinase n=1 Tax=Alteripontixanthobacter maritimus TaxID=2161824 RepID=A0A369Q2W8_9SPHN|nr:Polyphosphate kinase [Alteripontixanthobacter maritimus]
MFDRSWYNRAGVEKVMGFASNEEVARFLNEAPCFERMLVDDGILLFKYWLATDQDRQEERLAERLEDPLKRWKLSPMDLAAREKYAEYSDARETMLRATHTDHAPWTLVNFNDQKRGRLTLIRDLLDRLPNYDIAPPDIVFPPLGHEPLVEEYRVVAPLKDYVVE